MGLRHRRRQLSLKRGVPRRLHVEDHLRPVRQRFWRDLAEGWAEVRRHRWLTAGFLGFALGNVGIGMYFVLGPLVAREHLGGAQAWGLILTAGAVGGVIGGLFAYRVRPQHPVAAAFAIWAVGAIPTLALVPPLPTVAIMAASAVLSLAVIVGNTLWETALQQEVRPDRLARVGSIDWLLSLCLMPAGQTLAGPLCRRRGRPPDTRAGDRPDDRPEPLRARLRPRGTPPPPSAGAR
jgi:hypothetical protein